MTVIRRNSVSPVSVVTFCVRFLLGGACQARRQSRQILSIVRGDNSSGANSRTARHCPADDDARRCAAPALSTILYPQMFIDLFCHGIINIRYNDTNIIYISIVNGSQIGRRQRILLFNLLVLFPSIHVILVIFRYG